MRRGAYVATRRQLPFGGDVNVGMVARRDHSTVAALLLAVPEALRGVACAGKVQLTAYRATLVTADRLRIGDLVGSRLLDLEQLHSDDEAGRGGGVGRHGAGEEEFDWNVGVLPRAFNCSAAKARTSGGVRASGACLETGESEVGEGIYWTSS